jgi:hypothetical protein
MLEPQIAATDSNAQLLNGPAPNEHKGLFPPAARPVSGLIKNQTEESKRSSLDLG